MNENEIELIRLLDLSKNERLDRVRDLFLIGCYTGARFSDYTKIRKHNVIKDTCTFTMQKVKKDVVVPIYNETKTILEKYNYQLPPRISSQKMNEYIKEICKMAGITEKYHFQDESIEPTEKFKLVTTHTARRSFATNAFLDEIPVITIMRATGHSKESDFYRYIRMKPTDGAQRMVEMRNKRGKLKAV